MMTARLTVGITTRNRRASLRACVSSLSLLAHLDPEILIFDDGSDEPAAEQIRDCHLPSGARVIRDASAPGYIVGRNRIVREAQAPFVLLLDDDARLGTAEAIERAIEILKRDGRVAAVAFAQGGTDGQPWPASMQPSRATQPAIVPSFIGFAHLLRREAFLALGGYREIFHFYGEEKEFCLRVLGSGQHVVYLPDAIVIHAADPAGRDLVRYLRFLSRNDCLMAMYTDPLTRLVWMLPARYALYFRLRSALKVRDPWGWLWLARELWRSLPTVRAERSPASRATLRRWADLRRNPRPYLVEGA